MNIETDIDDLLEPRRKRGRPYAGGRDPLLVTRAPPAIVEAIRTRAARRQAAVSVIVREALEAYVRAQPDDERAA